MKYTALHEAAERGDTDSLQRLLDEGIYDVNERSDGRDFLWKEGVCLQKERERERERERAVWTYSLFLLISILWNVCGESQYVCHVM